MECGPSVHRGKKDGAIGGDRVFCLSVRLLEAPSTKGLVYGLGHREGMRDG